jgi:hypothetical protein
MTPEAYKATEAVEFIAEHLRNEDEYIQVRHMRRFCCCCAWYSLEPYSCTASNIHTTY